MPFLSKPDALLLSENAYANPKLPLPTGFTERADLGFQAGGAG